MYYLKQFQFFIIANNLRGIADNINANTFKSQVNADRLNGRLLSTAFEMIWKLQMR